MRYEHAKPLCGGAASHRQLDTASDSTRVGHVKIGNYRPQPADVVGAPVWLYPRERWGDGQFRLGPQYDVLREAIGSELDQLRSIA
ncbi:hypothetical protein [Streptomyces yanii]|uniref:Uncharacterized protein n=1 Tax=Streptomyces yanii TaxID=78510 RepID=A0ABV5R245_9ACTN